MADVEGAVLTAQINVEVDDWQEAVRASCHPLLEADAIEERYVDACIDLVKDQGPYIVVAPGIALVHARPEDGVRRLCLCATTLAQAVDFGHPDNDPVDLAFAFGSPDDSQHIGLLKSLAEELQGDLADRLRQAQTTEDAELLVKGIVQDVKET
jgi:PTS system ascorbate-specific IIA component